MSRRPFLPMFLLVSMLSLAPGTGQEMRPGEKLSAPADGQIPVAFVLAPGATMVDFAGPWEVFQDVMIPGAENPHPFQLYTVAASTAPIRATGGMQIIPDHSFADAPQPKVIVIPAQRLSEGVVEWIQKASREADMTMSVCTGAFLLARTGLLDGLSATTHHDFQNQFARRFPNIELRRDVRYVEGPRVATAAGLTSGIDLSLRIVERYFGPEVAGRTARFMEYDSEGWHRDRGYWVARTAVAGPAAPADAEPPAALMGNDPVLLSEGREVAGDPGRWVERGGYLYRFASDDTRKRFLADPRRYEIQFGGACAAMALRGGKPGSGDPDRYHVFEERIYVFASETCRAEFIANPARYVAGPGRISW